MRTILHVHNVVLIGGVPSFIVDLAAALDGFNHVAVALNQEREEPGAIQMLNDAGISCSTAPALTKEVVETLDPDLIFLHNISGASLQGKHPWSWIRDWPTVSWHHSAVSQTVPTDLHIFVSHFVESMYSNLVKSRFIKRYKIIPPCIQTVRYQGRPSQWKYRLGKIAAPFNQAKYPQHLCHLCVKNGWKILFPGASVWWGSAAVLDAPAPAWWKVPEWLSLMEIFVYVNEPSAPETWCRAVTEAMAAGKPVIADRAGGIPEQITDMKDGVLVQPGDWDEIEAAIKLLLAKPAFALQLGMAAFKRARGVDISVLKASLESELLRMM